MFLLRRALFLNDKVPCSEKFSDIPLFFKRTPENNFQSEVFLLPFVFRLLFVCYGACLLRQSSLPSSDNIRKLKMAEHFPIRKRNEWNIMLFILDGSVRN